MLTVFPVPAFADNYLWVIHNETHAIAVDPGDAAPVIGYLKKHRLQLAAVLVTHHHADHVGGITDLLAWCGQDVPVHGPADENIPHRTHLAVSGKNVPIAALRLEFAVMAVPGHTLGHMAYYEKKRGWLFCGDTLFGCGCGRLFEGTAAQMQASLAKLRALPATTQVFCGHEYTLANLRFALAVDPDNAALARRLASDTAKRERGDPTLPSTIRLEAATNPFMRWDSPMVIQAAMRVSKHPIRATPEQVFGAIRAWKDRF